MNFSSPTAGLPCWLEVDLDAIGANVAALRRWVQPRTRIAAVVKAQAYGCGAEQVARAALAAGASSLAVARVHEGVELRTAGIRAPILVMNRTDLAEVQQAVHHELTVTVDTTELGRALGAAAHKLRRTSRVHVKVDTGLHRFGVDPDATLPLVRSLSEISELEVQGLYTHFASADETDLHFTLDQLERFEQVSRELDVAGYRFPVRHAANSAGTLNVRAAHLDMVRCGITLHGESPLESYPAGLYLQAANSLKARVARITELPVGDGVGYGQTWHAQRPSRIALGTIGYADGIPRRFAQHGSALIGGCRAPIVGRVSMDQVTLDITDIPGVEVGDVITFFGSDGQARLPLREFAAACDTISYEAMTSLGGRVARVYQGDDAWQGTARLNGTAPLS
jgi:alanine racemase